LTPDIVGYSSAARALLENKKTDMTMELLKEMQLQRFDINPFVPQLQAGALALPGS
jgi:hypothetical protein